MNKSIIIMLLITVAITTRAQKPKEKLHHQLDRINDQGGLVGFGVSIFSKDSVLYQNGYGYADNESKIPYTVHTVQNIGSISKTFVGVSLMKAVELGLFSIDTPVNDILPFQVVHPRYPQKKITIGHLATHTSGIFDTEEGYDKSYVLENPDTVDPNIYNKEISKYVKTLLGNKPMALGDFLKEYLSSSGSLYKKKNFSKTGPGERYNYSNIGAALAGYCVEVASDKTFPEFTKEYIFDKIDVENIGWSYASIDKDKHAKLYSDNGKVLPEYSLVSYPDGGLRTSVAGLTKYLQEMINCYYGEGSVLEKQSARKMMLGKLTKEQYGVEDEPKSNYGYFWEHNRNSIIGHNGGDPGIVTLMYYYEETDMGAIFFTNSNGIDNPVATKSIQASWNAIRKYQKEIHE